MKKIIVASLFLFISLTAVLSYGLESGVPEAEGVSSPAILNWINAVESDVDALHSFVLVRHGKVISEGWWAPYEKESPHMLYSLSKSFTSTAVGMAVDEGTLSLDDKAISFFPDKLPENPNDNLKNMRIRDLLCMGTGNHNDTLGPMKSGQESDWIKVFLAQPVEHEPGTYFRYNTGATYMLSAILQKKSGQNLLDFLTPRLFTPLDIRNATWETSPQGIRTGGYGLKVRTRDIAALGQLYLQQGKWNGSQLISTNWVTLATSKQIANGDNPMSDWNQGYGFQFWRCRHNAFRADGAFGQYCIVIPDQDAVLAITSGLGNMQQVLDLVWTHLLPGLQSDPLKADPERQSALTKKLSSLTLRPVKGEASSPAAAGLAGRSYHFAENEKGLQSISLHPGEKSVLLKLRNGHGEQQIDCGYGQWKKGEIIFEKELIRPVGEANGKQTIAATGAWTAPDQYTSRIYFTETPFCLTMTMRFKEDQLELDLKYNLTFGSKKEYQIIGRQ